MIQLNNSVRPGDVMRRDLAEEEVRISEVDRAAGTFLSLSALQAQGLGASDKHPTDPAKMGIDVARGLRFAMVTTFYPPYHFGGDGELVRRLAHALVKRGHQVEIIHDVDAFRALGGGDREPLEEPEGLRVHPLRSRFGTLSCLATHQTGHPIVHGRRIRQILERGFDVIHFHNASLVGGPGVLACGDAIKLYSAHEHWLVCPTSVLWRHNRELCDGRQCVRCAFHYRRPPQLWRGGSLLERCVRHVDAFLTFSQSCIDKHREFGFERPMSVIPPFLPENESGPDDGTTTGRAPGEVPFFLFVGRLEAIKGLQDVIPLFRKEGSTELWIAGTGSYEPQLRRHAGGSHRVRFLGHCDAQELRRLYRAAIALVVPSLCYEVFPMVVLEAFREGTPILARDLGPFPEIVARSGGGLLFDSAEALEHSLTRLANDRPFRDQMGRAAKHALHAHWSEEGAMARYFRLIESLAEQRRLRHVLDRLADTRAEAAGAGR